MPGHTGFEHFAQCSFSELLLNHPRILEASSYHRVRFGATVQVAVRSIGAGFSYSCIADSRAFDRLGAGSYASRMLGLPIRNRQGAVARFQHVPPMDCRHEA